MCSLNDRVYRADILLAQTVSQEEHLRYRQFTEPPCMFPNLTAAISQPLPSTSILRQKIQIGSQNNVPPFFYLKITMRVYHKGFLSVG